MSKRILSFLLALVMVLGMIPAVALAANAASNIVAKVEAVGTGYTYDSEAGAYAPTFSSMTAYDPGGNPIDIEGFVWSSPFYTKANFGSANRLFHEPEGGETYYFSICVDQYVNADIQYDYAYPDFYQNSTALIPGFDVEFYNLMEREMGGYLELTYAATRKYHVVEVGDTKLYHGDTYQGSKGGTLTVDGYNVTMNNFKDPSTVSVPNKYCEDYYAENRPVYSDMKATLKLTIIGENSVGSIIAQRNLQIHGTMYDSLTIRKLELAPWDGTFVSSSDDHVEWLCQIYGGNYTMNLLDLGGITVEQSLGIYDGASVEVSGEVTARTLAVRNSKLAANSIYTSSDQQNDTPLFFGNSRIELIDRMYHHLWDGEDVWAEINGGAFKGKTDFIEITTQGRVGFDCLDFRAEMVGTGSAGSISGDIKIRGSYNLSYKPIPYDYIDVECKDARSITCENATASAETAVPGTAVTITADPAPEGKVFYRWEIKGLIKDIADPYAPTTTFTMDVADVTVNATYRKASGPVIAPTLNVSNVASTGKIKLTWDAVPGAAKYQVYRATSKTGTYSLLKTLTGTSLTNTSVDVGKTYYYKIRSVDANGNQSDFSSIVSRACDLPRPEVKVSNVSSTGKVKLTWTAVEGAAKYEVYRATSKDGTYSLLKTLTGTSLTNTSTTAGKTYFYKVKAIHSNSAANSAYSSVVSRTCDLSRPVVKVTNVASTGKVKLSWTAVEGAAKYEVYRATSKTGTYTKLSTTTNTTLTNTSTTAGTTYYYKVKAIHSNSAANSAYSSVVSRACDLPQPKVTVTNVASTGKVKLSWAAIEGASKYEIYRATSKDGTYTKLSTTTNTTLTNTSTTAGTTYYYKVKAIHSNSAANSAYSSIVSRTCDLAQPTLTVKLNSSGKPVLTWTKVEGAVSYKVYRATSKDGTYSLLKTLTGTSLTNTSVTAGKTYYYKVVAIHSNTAANSAYSAIKSVTVK